MYNGILTIESSTSVYLQQQLSSMKIVLERTRYFIIGPGPMVYTVYAFARDPKGSNDITTVNVAFQQSKLYCHSRFNFAGGNGSWLVVEGGPYLDKDGTEFQPCDLTI